MNCNELNLKEKTMITVMGATGNTGRKITELLLEAGEEVRALGAKTVAGDVRDADYLASTFAGADAVYTLTAFDPTLPDYHADQDRRGDAIASAIRQSGVRHVVALSALGGELASGNGFITSLHRQERRLRALDRVNLMILRPGAFFEGFYAALDTIRHEGVVADSVAPEAKVPMIATADIAQSPPGRCRSGTGEASWSASCSARTTSPTPRPRRRLVRRSVSRTSSTSSCPTKSWRRSSLRPPGSHLTSSIAGGDDELRAASSDDADRRLRRCQWPRKSITS